MERGHPHPPEGGEHQHETREGQATGPEPIFEQLTDEQRIQRGIADALTKGRPIDDETARRIAAQLHAGQETALHALASSGALDERLERELLESVQDLPATRDSWIDALLDYVDARGEDRGPREGWVTVTREEFEQFTLPTEQIVEHTAVEPAEQRMRDRQQFDRVMETGQEAETAEDETSPEQEDRPQPRIYVRCLAAYTNGLLHGQWIDADQDPRMLWDEIETMLNASPAPEAEEYVIHDYEGFMGYELGEHEDLVTVSRVARGIAEHGRAFVLYVEWAGNDEEALGQFDDHFMGRWDSVEDWARDAGEEFGWERQLRALGIDPIIRPYVKIDYVAFAQDMASHWHMVEAEDGVYVFAL